MEGEQEQIEELRDNQKEVLSRRISFWLSFILAVGISFWYYALNPPDSTEMQKMRLFFKENIMDVAKFIRLPDDELQGFAALKSHPFYQTYLKSSEVEKEKIRALIHISRDYSPNQYLFNIVFLWTIAFTTLWFLGLILEAIIILVRREDTARRERIKNNLDNHSKD
jgi:4-amino-4-deoxy-L-arabinose transferase-like glycosyltransferase